jgi:hypothetical protein
VWYNPRESGSKAKVSRVLLTISFVIECLVVRWKEESTSTKSKTFYYSTVGTYSSLYWWVNDPDSHITAAKAKIENIFVCTILERIMPIYF